ncbi:MAG: response regulator [Lachnospiraceae bacterium]|jgi:DNA-binding LytR/AlgR family response regulator|nr:response regulator [Lachnospiraceae bacterium]
MSLKIAVCEDDPTQAKNMKRLLSDWSSERGLAAVIRSYDGCEAFLTDWMQKMNFDLLLLDIDLGGGMNGMELARRIRRKDEGVALIFVTGLPEYMSQGYDVRACHFLVKPVEEEKLKSVLNRS